MGQHMPEQLPDFLGIGTQKGGTTTLHRLLREHPQIFLPEFKEVHFFSLHSEKPTSWYASHYKNAKKDMIKGDITPLYIFDPKSPGLIKKVLPNVKIIALLRDPVERTLSQIYHSKRHGFEPLNPADALKMEKERLENGNEYSFQKHSYLARSRYIEQLERYEKLFPRENILIIKSEKFFANESTSWIQIQQFLGLEIKPTPPTMPKANPGKGEARNVDPKLKQWLREELYETAREVKRRYGIDWGWL